MREKSRLIVVLGMHRSGTSAITRTLKVLGVELGERMLPPVEGNNPKGFWEDIDLNALNIEMLSAIDSDWCHVTAIDQADIEVLHKKGYFIRAAELLRQKVGNTPIFGFKDPRVTKLLPFWKEVFSCCQFDISYLLAVRHPLSVVKSLATRDGIETELSYLLWLGHVITSLTNSAGNNRVLVDYDLLMQTPVREITRIAKGIGLKIVPAELQSYTSEFLDQSLRHTVFDLNDLLLDDTCPPVVHDLYTALLDVASDKVGLDELGDKIVSWSDEFKRLKSPLLLIDKLFVQKEAQTQVKAYLSARDQHIIGLEHTIADQANHIRAVEADRAMLGRHVTGLEHTIANQANHIRAVEADRAMLVTGLEHTIANQANHIRAVEADRAALGQTIINQADHIRAVEAALMRFQNSLYGKCYSGWLRLSSLMRNK